MKRLLITGGTVFISKFTAKYFVKRGYEVYVLNRNTRKQIEGVHLIEADRHDLKDVLKQYSFDAIIDVCAYTKQDIKDLINHINNIQDYIFISSSAVYPESEKQPFQEETRREYNEIWKDYGINKVEAEDYLLSKVPNAYILRPPYLYGPMQNLYREPFVFECALKNRTFYIPKNGKMKLQFFHVEDLCKVIEYIIINHPKNHIYNVGNEDLVDINTFVKICYEIVGQKLKVKHVYDHENQRDYFSFHNYEYELDISKQKEILPQTKDLKEGLKESFDYYIHHQEEVTRKDYMSFIDNHLLEGRKNK